MIDRHQLIDLLRQSAATFTGSFASLAPPQFHFSPGADRWSIAQNAEHVIVAETGSGKLITRKLIAAEATPEALEAAADGEARINRRLAKRDQAFPAPEFVLPTGRWQTPGEMVGVFDQSRNATIAFLETTDLDLRRYIAPHPALGPLDGHQWAYFLVRHCLRHVEQIEEVKRAAGYPAA